MQPRVPVLWPVTLGGGSLLLGMATNSAGSVFLGEVALFGGAVVAGGDFICDRVRKAREKRK